MKKRYLPLVLLLCLSFCLTACGGERYDSLIYIDHENGLTFGLRGTGTRPKQIVVKQGEDILWNTSVKIPKSVGSLGGTYGFDCPDLNLDGHPDIMLAEGVAGDCISYRCWLYDPQTQDYLLSEELTGLCNLQVDLGLEALFAFTHTYTEEEAYQDTPASHEWTDAATKYLWKDGILTPEIRVSITYYSKADRYCYSVAYYNEDDQSFEQSYDDWLTPDEYKEIDMSFLYYFK